MMLPFYTGMRYAVAVFGDSWKMSIQMGPSWPDAAWKK